MAMVGMGRRLLVKKWAIDVSDDTTVDGQHLCEQVQDVLKRGLAMWSE